MTGPIGFTDYTERYDAANVPPAGAGCFVCRLNGHYCPASGALGVGDVDLWICAACVAGTPCARRLVLLSVEQDWLPEMPVLAHAVSIDRWQGERFFGSGTVQSVWKSEWRIAQEAARIVEKDKIARAPMVRVPVAAVVVQRPCRSIAKPHVRVKHPVQAQRLVVRPVREAKMPKPVRLCATPDCGKRLNSSNRSGICKSCWKPKRYSLMREANPRPLCTGGCGRSIRVDCVVRMCRGCARAHKAMAQPQAAPPCACGAPRLVHKTVCRECRNARAREYRAAGKAAMKGSA